MKREENQGPARSQAGRHLHEVPWEAVLGEGLGHAPACPS